MIMRYRSLPLFVRVVLLAVALNVPAWVGAASFPGALEIWKYVSLLGTFALGFVIGRWWALWVVVAFGVIHAIPVYLGWTQGYLSTWAEALWWTFALSLLVALAALGVIARRAIHRFQNRASLDL